MSDQKTTPIVELVNSNELGTFLINSRRFQKNTDEWAKIQTQEIIRCAERVCERYNELRSEYNQSKDQGSVYILPNIRINDSGLRTYPTFRWIQFMNDMYLGRAKTEKNWTVREIARRGKTHFSVNDLEKAMQFKNNDFLPVVMETEHCLRFCREQYNKIKLIAALGRKLKLSDYHLSLSMTDVDLLANDKKEAVEHIRQHSKRGIFLEDPLCLSAKASLFDEFYKLPDIHQKEIDEKLGLDDVDVESNNFEF